MAEQTHMQGAVAKFNKLVADYYKGLETIKRDINAGSDRIDPSIANANRSKREEKWLSSFVDKWKRVAEEIERETTRIRRRQPALVDFDSGNPPPVSAVPMELFIGSRQISFRGLSCSIPQLIPFPFARALVLPEGGILQAHHLLLRLLSALPAGLLELTFIDPLKLGKSIEPFLSLLKAKELVPYQRVLTRSDEIEAAFAKLTADVEDTIQHRFGDRASDWSKYNSGNGDNPLPYRVSLLFDAPEQLSDKSLWYLGRLCENGPRCGVLPIIVTGGQHPDSKQQEKFRAAIEATTNLLDAVQPSSETGQSGLAFEHMPEQWPPHHSLDRYISEVIERYATNARFNKAMPDLWVDFAKDATTIAGFDIPLGWTPAGEIVPLRLGATDSEHHALLAGKTGSGKSNLLHVLIHSLCEKYPPNEVELYLLDYKESTEFTVYADPPLPHARLVATESDPEFGVTVLRHLVEKLEERASLFKASNVRDFAEYRGQTLGQLPRLLLVIDEFQVLFSEARTVAEPAEQLLSRLLKQGRSFGIHVILATQTLKGITAQSIGSIITQLGCRIALACGQEDSAAVLGGGNWAAAELHSPPEGIINNANGQKSGNIKFLIPLAESVFCRSHIAKLSECASRRGAPSKTRIFSGANLPEMPIVGDYQTVCGQADALLLGERLSFETEVLSIPITRRPSFNVLFCGYNDRIHDGLLVSLLSSSAYAGGFDEVIYFNGRGMAPAKGFDSASQALGRRFKPFDEVSALPLQEIADGIGSSRIALIIDGLDSEKALHPPQLFKTTKPNEQPSQADLLRRVAEEGPRKGTFVYAFVDRWQRCAIACKDLLSFFELRVAYCMSEDDAGALVSGGVGKFKGIEKPNRAVFVDKMVNEIAWFRPYVQGGSR